MAGSRFAALKPRFSPATLWGTSALLALSSLVALGAQALLGLAMLRWFAPEAAGHFAVVAQVAFFWMTLALAQSPLKFLADTHIHASKHPRDVLHTVLRASALRWLALAPVVTLALWWALPKQPVMAMTLIWAGTLSLLQMLWYLAQPWTLRTRSTASTALVRAAPAVLALVLAVALAWQWPAHSGNNHDAHANVLLWAAASGYALGALWLLPALRRTGWSPAGASPPATPQPAATVLTSTQGDDRSTALRLAHTLTDAIVGAALLLVWQRLHAMAETSYLAVLLRLLGFMPTLVHAAWAQVLLVRTHTARWPSLAVGVGAMCATALMGALGAALITYSPWASAWRGLLPYIVPLVLWQGSACVFAALSHRPFQTGQARRYTYCAITVQVLQLAVLCWPLVQAQPWSAPVHLWYLASTCTAGLLALSLWMLNHKPPPIAHDRLSR